VVNPHKVTPEQCHKALKLMRESYDKAYKEGFLIAWHRILTFVRGPDHED